MPTWPYRFMLSDLCFCSMLKFYLVEGIWGYRTPVSESWWHSIDIEVWRISFPFHIRSIWHAHHPVHLWAMWPYTGKVCTYSWVRLLEQKTAWAHFSLIKLHLMERDLKKPHSPCTSHLKTEMWKRWLLKSMDDVTLAMFSILICGM